MNKWAFILSAVTSLLLTILLWNTCDWTTDQLVDYLRGKHYVLGAWILHHYVFALSFGLVPIVCFLICLLGKRKNAWGLLAYMFFSWTSTLLLIVLVFKTLTIDINASSPLLPEFKRFNVPFYEYWNHTLPKLSLIVPVFFLALNITHRFKLNKLQDAARPLDQITEEK